MAITVQKQAPDHCAAYNSCYWVLSSTETPEDNFRYVMDIYITGQTFAGSNYIRVKRPADPTNGRGVFNPNTILERYLSYDLSIAATGAEYVKQAGNSILDYTLKFGEEYGPSSAVTVYPDLATVSGKYAHNMVFDHIDYIDFINTSGSAYLNAATSSKLFLTNSPRTLYVRSNENMWLQCINDATGSTASARINYTSWTSSDVLVASALVINNTYSGLSNTDDRRIIIPAGWNIDQIRSADIISGSLPLVSPANVAYWKIKATNSTGTATSEEFIVRKDSTCTNHPEFRLHFLNEYGAFDSFTFTRGSDFETDVKERKKYSKPLGKFIATNNFMYEGADRHDVPFYTELKDGITLNSEWVNQDYYHWLEELITSPVVFVENPSYSRSQDSTITTLSPVTITEKKHERKKRITDRLFNIKIKIEPSYNRYRQRA